MVTMTTMMLSVRLIGVTVVMVVMVGGMPVFEVAAKCPSFHFPTAEVNATKKSDRAEHTVQALENHVASIPFTLHFNSCRNSSSSSSSSSSIESQSYTITVSKMKSTNGHVFEDVCKIRVSGSGVPFFVSYNCKVDEKGRYSFNKRVDQSDGTLWQWRASFPDGNSSESYVWLDVVYPPEFLEAEGGGGVRAFELKADEPWDLEFRVRSHTSTVTACWLSPWPHVPGVRNTDCVSYITMHGSPPIMTLTLRIPRVTSYNMGTWSLNITNDVGSDDVIFRIELLPRGIDKPSFSSSNDTTVDPREQATPDSRGPFFIEQEIRDDNEDVKNDEDGDLGQVIVMVIVGVVVFVLVAVNVAVFFTCRRLELFDQMRRTSICCPPCACLRGSAPRRQSQTDVYYSRPQARGGQGGSGDGEVTYMDHYSALGVSPLSPANASPAVDGDAAVRRADNPIHTHHPPPPPPSRDANYGGDNGGYEVPRDLLSQPARC